MAKSKGTAAKAKNNAGESAPAEAAPPQAVAAPKTTSKKPAGRRRGRRRRVKPATQSVAKAKAVVRRAPRKASSKRGRRYTPAERRRILSVARTEGLSGPKAAKRFGISMLTFYKWRKKAGGAKRRGLRGRSRPKVTGVRRRARGPSNLVEQIRQAIRTHVARLTPQIIQSEITQALSGVGQRRRRRG